MRLAEDALTDPTNRKVRSFGQLYTILKRDLQVRGGGAAWLPPPTRSLIEVEVVPTELEGGGEAVWRLAQVW